MKKYIILSAVLLFAVSSVSAGNVWNKLFRHKNIKGSGEITTIERQIDNFTRLKSSGSYDIKVTVGDEPSLKITFDDNLIEFITTEVSGNTLEIDSEESFSTRKSCKIEITVPDLEEVRLSGSGEIEVYNLNSEFFEFKLSGSGDLYAEGHTDELDVSVSGSGNIDTGDLIAKRVSSKITGSGNILVYAEEELDATISGSGNIRYYGTPEDISEHVTGSGSINKKK